MTPRRRSASAMYDAAFAALDAAAAQSRVEQAATEARIAQLKLAAELERQGRYKEAEKIIVAVQREQERLDTVRGEVQSASRHPTEGAPCQASPN